MSGDSGVVKNWLPGEPGKYVTILDLKEQWMKKKKHEDEEEGKRKRMMKEVEKKREEEKKKVFERLDEMKIGGEDRVEGKCVEVGNGRWRSGGKGRGRRIRSEVGGSKTRIDERKGGDDELVRVLQTEKSEYNKKGLEVNDVRANGDDVVGNYNAKVGSGRYWSGKRISRDGSAVKGIVSGVTENVGVDVDVEKSEEVDSIGIEKGIRTNCPCHSKVDNQGGGGFWVCKYVEQVPRAEIGQIMTGNEAAKGDTSDNAWKKNDRMKEVKLEKKHRLPRKLRKKMTTKREKEDAKQGHGDFPMVVDHDDVMWKGWQPREKWEMTKGVNDEVMEKQIQREEMAVDKDMRTIISQDGSGKKSVMKDQSEIVELSFEIEEHCKASLVMERERIRIGKFRARDCPVDGRKIYDTGRFKAEKNLGSLPTDYLKKDSLHVNSSRKKKINQIASLGVIDGSTLKLENKEPVDCPEKSEAPLYAEMVENSSVRSRGTSNGIYPKRMVVNKMIQNEGMFVNERLTNSGKLYGKREIRLKREGFMWVKKGEAPIGNAGGRNSKEPKNYMYSNFGGLVA